VGWQAQFNACDVAHRPTPTWQACFDEPIYIVQTLTVVFSTLGAIEMAVKLFGFGLPRFVSNWWNGADLFIVIVTAASSLIMWLNAREYLTDTTNAGISDILEIGRALRVMRVITLEPQFRAVFESIVDCFSACVVSPPRLFSARPLCSRRAASRRPRNNRSLAHARFTIVPALRVAPPSGLPSFRRSSFLLFANSLFAQSILLLAAASFCSVLRFRSSLLFTLQPPALLRADVVRRLLVRDRRHDALRRRTRGDGQRS
jgi:hypothetical protein